MADRTSTIARATSGGPRLNGLSMTRSADGSLRINLRAWSGDVDQMSRTHQGQLMEMNLVPFERCASQESSVWYTTLAEIERQG